MAQAVEPIAEGPRPDRAAPIGAPRQKGELEPLAVTAERVHTTLPKEKAVYPGRFMLGYLLIVLFFGALLVAFAVGWSQRSDDNDGATATNWSFFKPTAGTEELRTRQIATFVGDRYQTGDGQQIARVLGGPPAFQDAPVSQFVIRDGSAQETIGADKALMFLLCATGPDCVLPAANSTSADVRLFRREALELSLYTMRYNDVDPVVVLLPPDPQGNPGSAILFRRDDLKTQLERPLSQTLPAEKAPSAVGMGELEAATVDYFTLKNKFAYEFQSTSDGTARMIMNPDRPVE